jgi:hypothetical protein
MVAGVVSLERLGLNEVMAEIEAPDEKSAGAVPERSPAAEKVVAFLVDSEGKIIYHPDPAQIGQDLKERLGPRITSSQAGSNR